ncbi:MAG TPA: prepilin-type N-terminal cleavage/methylation domain-containing protein [Longimicrobiales bacterium]
MAATRRRPGPSGREERARGQAGFSLLEVLIIVTVFSILLGLAMPRVDVEAFRLNEAAREVAAALARAQYRALLHQYDVVVWFEVTDRRVRIHDDRNNDGLVQPGEPVSAVALPDGVVFGRGSAPQRAMGPGPVTFRQRLGVPYVTFHRNGSASEAGGLYLTSTRPGSAAARAIEVERATGRATWLLFDGSSWRGGT